MPLFLSTKLVQFKTAAVKEVFFFLTVPISYMLLCRRYVLSVISVKKFSTVRLLPLPKWGFERAMAVFLSMFVSLILLIFPIEENASLWIAYIMKIFIPHFVYFKWEILQKCTTVPYGVQGVKCVDLDLCNEGFSFYRYMYKENVGMLFYKTQERKHRLSWEGIGMLFIYIKESLV